MAIAVAVAPVFPADVAAIIVVVDRHIVRHWLCLLSPLLKDLRWQVALNGHMQFSSVVNRWLGWLSVAVLATAPGGLFGPKETAREIGRLSRAFGHCFGSYEWAIVVGDNRNGLWPRFGGISFRQM